MATELLASGASPFVYITTLCRVGAHVEKSCNPATRKMVSLFALDDATRQALQKDDRRPLVFAVCIPLMVAAISAVGLRIFARRIAKTSLRAEDWVILLALVMRVSGFCGAIRLTMLIRFSNVLIYLL